MSAIDAYFETVHLPSIPDLAHTLIATLNDDTASISAVSALIEQDPAIAAQLLRLANSAQFGLPRGVGNLDEAMAMVGMAKLRTLALAACVCNAFPATAGLDMPRFWRSCLATAGYAEWLARQVGVDAPMAWLTGMVLRLGELLMAQAQPESLQAIERLPLEPGIRWQREKRLTGFTEGELTAELARRWNFPMQMAQALQRAADPLVEQAYSRLGAIVHIAALLADTPDAGPQQVDGLPSDVLQALGLEPDWLRAHFPRHAGAVEVH